MNPNKALGPDGLSSIFFTSCWDIVGSDVVAMIQHFFISGSLLPELNQTNLVLIPKHEHPILPSEFRPISLCNIFYKLIAKLLADCLKPLLCNLISLNQMTFMPGCRIQDNYLVAVELFHSMKHKSERMGWMAIKGDMEKAYDRVEWSFLLTILRQFSFSPHWVLMIEQCISTPQFSLLLQGSPFAHFSGSRGLRQGDPCPRFCFFLSLMSCLDS